MPNAIDKILMPSRCGLSSDKTLNMSQKGLPPRQTSSFVGRFEDDDKRHDRGKNSDLRQKSKEIEAL